MGNSKYLLIFIVIKKFILFKAFFLKLLLLFLLLPFFIENLFVIFISLLKTMNSNNIAELEIINSLNQTKHNMNKSKVKISIYSISLCNGGVERNTAILINYLDTIKIFELYLFTDLIAKNEYKIPKGIKRIKIYHKPKMLKRNLLKYKINILIYQFYETKVIQMIKSIKNLKIIFYNHSCFLFWIYINRKDILKNIYNEYQMSKYVISIVPFEHNYLLKKWGINSIYMNNFMTYDYNKVIQSNLSTNKILMLGRGNDINKRFDLGIKTMKFIVKEIIDSQMIIISNEKELLNIKILVKDLDLDNNIKFFGYTSTPEIYFKDASLHIFPSIAEAFPMVLSETKMYGIPNILIGIDYVANAKDGDIIIYDDNPEIISKNAIKILKNKAYKKKLSKEARKSMKKFNNNHLLELWIKLILNVYNGENFDQNRKENDKYVFEDESLFILKNQIQLLRKRVSNLKNININNIINFTFIKELNYL